MFCIEDQTSSYSPISCQVLLLKQNFTKIYEDRIIFDLRYMSSTIADRDYLVTSLLITNGSHALTGTVDVEWTHIQIITLNP